MRGMRASALLTMLLLALVLSGAAAQQRSRARLPRYPCTAGGVLPYPTPLPPAPIPSEGCEPVQCLAAPCATHQCAADEQCVDDYCGGCFAKCEKLAALVPSPEGEPAEVAPGAAEPAVPATEHCTGVFCPCFGVVCPPGQACEPKADRCVPAAGGSHPQQCVPAWSQARQTE